MLVMCLSRRVCTIRSHSNRSWPFENFLCLAPRVVVVLDAAFLVIGFLLAYRLFFTRDKAQRSGNHGQWVHAHSPDVRSSELAHTACLRHVVNKSETMCKLMWCVDKGSSVCAVRSRARSQREMFVGFVSHDALFLASWPSLMSV